MKGKNPTLGTKYGYPFFKKQLVIDQQILPQARIVKVIQELRFHYPDKGPDQITWQDFGNIRIDMVRKSKKHPMNNFEKVVMDDIEDSYRIITQKIFTPKTTIKKLFSILFFLRV